MVGQALKTNIEQKFRQVENLVGNTPIYVINFKFQDEKRTIYAKAEHLNLTGSIKDRMALHILRDAYQNGDIKEGDTIVEATSGNTGIAFAAIGKAFGHPVKIYMPDWMSFERKAIIKSFGAEEVLVSHEEGGFLGSIALCEKLFEEEENIFLPHQFSNCANSKAHYDGTGKEIWHQLEKLNLVPDAFVAGVGTGGTVMGVGNYLKEKNPNVKIHPLEPSESPTLSTGYKVGKHRIQGISDEFIPDLCELKKLDEIIAVSDGDSILMAQKLASSLGLAVGISSGANFLGALIAQNKLGADAVVATVFCDSNKKYLSTDLVKEEPIKENYLSPEIELIDFETIGRL
ncbi:MAG: PLP-dependent cysteine synthase family protein [Pyrinomonadaceae bacterium]|nr:PLP-dependent cysteine synthase family protein [Pyrinomonadaceae bacterium]